MYMNGRGPMGRGFGPTGRPMHHRPMGYRPMGMRHRPMGFFPIGGLFILPALVFGGWIAIAVAAGILSIVGSVIGEIFSEVFSLTSASFSGSGLVIGIVIGLAVFCCFRNMKREEAARKENTGTVDGVEVEQIIEPEKVYRKNY